MCNYIYDPLVRISFFASFHDYTRLENKLNLSFKALLLFIHLKPVTGICNLYFSHLQDVTTLHNNPLNVGLPIPNTNCLQPNLTGVS
jgi:hypothetical protein